MTQFTTQNNSRRRLAILLILGLLFLSPERGVRADPEPQPERTADSETVDGKFWERLISRCDVGIGFSIRENNLPDDFLDELPENAKAVARRVRRCQDRV